MMPDIFSMGDMALFPLWATAALAAILAVAAVVAMQRFGSRPVVGAIAAVAIVGGLGWFALERLEKQSRTEQRRAIESRVAALNAQALLPNSNLACLDAAGGDLVYEACEKALFAGPEQIAAALNYVGTRLDVLREIAALPNRDDAAYVSLRAPMLRSLEADRFALVSQVLMARDDCQPASCYAFDFLVRRDQIVANMNERAYDARVERYATLWSDKPGAPAAPALAAQAAAPTPPQSPVNINFPTASSIPPVSIMSNEPGRPGQNGVETTARSEARPQTSQAPQPPRRPAPKAQAPRPATASPAQEATPADPFPQPVGSAQQTTGTQQQ